MSPLIAKFLIILVILSPFVLLYLWRERQLKLATARREQAMQEGIETPGVVVDRISRWVYPYHDLDTVVVEAEYEGQRLEFVDQWIKPVRDYIFGPVTMDGRYAPGTNVRVKFLPQSKDIFIIIDPADEN